jgi:hypothetical protein
MRKTTSTALPAIRSHVKEIAKQQVFETKQPIGGARFSERGDSAPGYTKSGSGFFESGV